MAKFGRKSTTQLSTCHPLLQQLFNEIVKEYDCSILEGARSIQRQQLLFDAGNSKTMNSKHIPVNGWSRAVDVVPYPISWGGKEQKNLLLAINTRNKKELNKLLTEYKLVFGRFYHFAGYVQGIAKSMNIELIWGGDWDSDKKFGDQTFHDLPHFQLK